jgi:hypothetical protein
MIIPILFKWVHIQRIQCVNSTTKNANNKKPMKESHLKELGVLAAKAFHNDPGLSWIFYDESTRHEYNAWLWERMLWISAT